MATLSSLSIRRPRWTIAVWLLLVGLALPLALTLEGQLKAGGFDDPRGESARTQQVLRDAFGDPENTLEVVVHSEGDVRAPAAEVAEAAGTLTHVTGVGTWQDNPDWLSHDGRTAVVQVRLDADNTTTQNLVEDLRSRVDAALAAQAADAGPPRVEASVTGAPALDYDLNVRSKADATRAEMIAFPLLFVVLFLVFRSVGAMLVPLVLSGIALVVSQGIGHLVARVTDLSILYTNGVSLIGLAVAVDYSLFIIKRYREELAQGSDHSPALATAMRTSGHAVVFSALAVVVALSTLLIPRLMVFTSIGLAGVIVTLVALATSMTLLPAVLTLMGRRINLWSLPSRKPAPAAAGRPARQGLRVPPVVVLVTLTVAFLAMAWPMTSIRLQVPVASAEILPAGTDSREGIERLRSSLGTDGFFPLQVAVQGPDRSTTEAAARSVAERAGGMPDVTAAQWDGRVAEDDGHPVARVVVRTPLDPDSVAAHDLVDRLRAELPGAAASGSTVGVTGATARGTDFDRVVVRSAGGILGGVAVATLLLLTWAFRSWRLPLLALALNALVVSASLGLLTLLTQDVLGEQVNSVTPLLLFAIMFGLSMDYLVIMISRMRESYLAGAGHEVAVSAGLRQTAALVNGAALIMVAVFLSFVSAEISIVRQLGIGLAMAVLLDALVVRLLLMPAALRVLGPRAWGRGGASRASSTPDATRDDVTPELVGAP